MRLGCEQYEERINPAGDGWLDTYASYFPDIGLGEHVLYPIVNLVFSDETLANATDTQLVVGTAGVVVVAVVGAEVAVGAATGSSIGTLLTGGATAAAVDGIGTTAVVAPGLGAGTYPGLLINGTVYVARFHQVAWQMAGMAEPVQIYGIVTIGAGGKVISWMSR